MAELAPELRALVSELLHCDSGGEETLFQTIESAAALFSRLSQQIGNWKLVRPLGEGGMGAVYLGVRTDGTFDRKVAIKFVRRGTDSPSLRLRLEAERRILSRLDHPNIARLLDAGATPEGQPYLVMDYVEGRSIIDYVSQQNLTVQQQVELFLQVCSAVEYAHRNLVVHRDLKPGNILVEVSGTVRLLDFGIAKLLDPSGLSLSPSRTAYFAPGGSPGCQRILSGVHTSCPAATEITREPRKRRRLIMVLKYQPATAFHQPILAIEFAYRPKT